MAKTKTYTQSVVDVICEHLETRACDPWDDDLWPAAKAVLSGMAEELRGMRREIADQAWAQHQMDKKGHDRG